MRLQSILSLEPILIVLLSAALSTLKAEIAEHFPHFTTGFFITNNGTGPIKDRPKPLSSKVSDFEDLIRYLTPTAPKREEV